MPRWREFLWPPLPDRDAARQAAMRGTIAAAFVAVYVALAPDLARTFALEPTYWINVAAAAAWALIALGIRAMSRFAAAAALILFVLERGLALQAGGRAIAILLALLFAIFFITAVRATQRFHELAALPDQRAPPR